MRGLTMPAETEDFTADPVELFFDLAFVFAFSQMVGVLVHHPDWTHVGEVALLFGLLWLPWQQFTWSANAVAGNSRGARMLLLAATVVSVPMAASVSTAMDEGGPVFAMTIAALFVLGVGLMRSGTDAGSDLSRTIRQWVGINALALALLVGGAFVADDARVVAWVAALAVILVAMARAGGGQWVLRIGHMAERHALIVIIALGEVIVAIGLPVVESLSGGAGVPGPTVAVLLAAGVFVATLWWSYFDRPAPALEHRGESMATASERSRYVRDVYSWSHAPIVAGIIVAAAAIEEMAIHPTDTVPSEFRAMLAGGMLLIFAGIATGIWRSFRVVARERLVGAVVAAAIVAAGGSLSGLTLIVAVDLVLVVMLVVENRRIER